MFRGKTRYSLIKKPAVFSLMAFFLSLTVCGSVYGSSTAEFIKASASIEKASMGEGETSAAHTEHREPSPIGMPPVAMAMGTMEDFLGYVVDEDIVIRKETESETIRIKSRNDGNMADASEPAPVVNSSETVDLSDDVRKGAVLSQMVAATKKNSAGTESETGETTVPAPEIVAVEAKHRNDDVLISLLELVMGRDFFSERDRTPSQRQVVHINRLAKGQKNIPMAGSPAPAETEPLKPMGSNHPSSYPDSEESLHLSSHDGEERNRQQRESRKEIVARQVSSLSAPVSPQKKEHPATPAKPQEKERRAESVSEKQASISRAKDIIYELAVQMGLPEDKVREFLYGHPDASRQDAENALKGIKPQTATSKNAKAGGGVQQAVPSGNQSTHQAASAKPAESASPNPSVAARRAATPANVKAQSAEKSWLEELEEMLLKDAQKRAERREAARNKK